MPQFTNLLDVAIVLAAVYIALSTISSFINEQIATFLKLRGKKLFLGVANLVTSRTLANAIFDHPAITTTVNDKGGIQDRPAEPKRPSYIDPHNFAIAFWDELTNAVEGIYPATNRAAQAVADATTAVAVNPAAAPRLQAANELQQMRAAASPLTGTGVLPDGARFEDLRQVVQSLPLGELKTNAMQLIVLAENDYSNLLTQTEAWFNRQMHAVEGWYTRQSRYIAVALGVAIVFFTGLDTFEIAQRLYTAPAVVSEAAARVLAGAGNSQQSAVSTAARDLLKGNSFLQFFHPCLGLPAARPCLVGTNAAYIDEPAVNGIKRVRDASLARDQAQFDMALETDSEAKQAVIDDRDALTNADAQLRKDRQAGDSTRAQQDKARIAELVTRINADVTSAQTASAALTAAQQSLGEYAPLSSHIAGWLVTAFAISLGAPFWFDVLNKIVNVRNAGQKPSTEPN